MLFFMIITSTCITHGNIRSVVGLISNVYDVASVCVVLFISNCGVAIVVIVVIVVTVVIVVIVSIVVIDVIDVDNIVVIVVVIVVTDVISHVLI
jgi:hypothetical protein